MKMRYRKSSLAVVKRLMVLRSSAVAVQFLLDATKAKMLSWELFIAYCLETDCSDHTHTPPYPRAIGLSPYFNIDFFEETEDTEGRPKPEYTIAFEYDKPGMRIRKEKQFRITAKNYKTWEVANAFYKNCYTIAAKETERSVARFYS